MKSLLGKLAIAVVLFAGSLVVGLAATGRLNHAGTANIPLLARFFPAPALPECGATPIGETAAASKRGEPGSAADATQSRQAQEPQATSRKQKTGRSVVRHETPRELAQGAGPSVTGTGDKGKPAETTAAAAPEHDAGQLQQPLAQEPDNRYTPGKLFEFEGMPAGLTPEQINEAWQRVQSELEEIARRKTQLDLREQELQELAADVTRRQKELGHERTRIAEEHLRLDARIQKFEEQVKLVRKDEASAYKRNAMTLSALGSNKAAELISDQWKTDRGQEEVLKLLEFMDEDDLAGILEQLPTAIVQDLMSKRLRVGKEAAPSGSRK
ncbi:MAG TPA: hypothetical protein VFD82_09220 [Planctomycetota bacterium]|nr:hypothetical protein [Planctomycetota bacterium]